PFDTVTAQKSLDNRIATSHTLSAPSIDQWGLTGEIEIPLSDSADLIYIGSYREYSSTDSYDASFSGLDLLNVLPGGATEIDTMTHEMRIQGEALGGA